MEEVMREFLTETPLGCCNLHTLAFDPSLKPEHIPLFIPLDPKKRFDYSLSFNPHLTLELLEVFQEEVNWCWKSLAANRAFTLEEIFENPSLPWNPQGLSFNPNLRLEHVLAHPEIKWNFSLLSEHANITFHEIWEHPELPWDASKFPYNPNLRPEHLLRLQSFLLLERGRFSFDLSLPELQKKYKTHWCSLEFWGFSNPPPLTWFLESSKLKHLTRHPDFTGAVLRKLVGGTGTPKLLRTALGNSTLSWRDLKWMEEELPKELALAEEGLAKDIRYDYLPYWRESTNSKLSWHWWFWIRTNIRIELSDIITCPEMERLFKEITYLSRVVRFTPEEFLPELPWNLYDLSYNRCITLELFSKFPDWKKYAGNLFIAESFFHIPTPFTFPDCREVQKHLYKRLDRGRRLDLALTYWCLGKRGKLPVELVALVASYVMGRVYPKPLVFSRN